MSHVMNEDNGHLDEERHKPSRPSQNQIPPSPKKKERKKKTSVYIVGDSTIKKVDGYLPTVSLKHQYLVKARLFSAVKMIDMYDYIKPTLGDFNQKLFASWNKLSSLK